MLSDELMRMLKLSTLFSSLHLTLIRGVLLHAHMFTLAPESLHTLTVRNVFLEGLILQTQV